MGYSSDQASSLIAEADGSIRTAFVAVAEAEQAGANVSSLVMRLNEIGPVLTEANVAFRTGDYDNASLLAGRCVSLVDGVASEAQYLKNSAESARRNQLMLVTSASSVGLCVLFVVGLFGWKFLKWRFVKHALGMKPEEVTEV